MMTPQCPREQAIIDAIVADRWPHACDESIREHALHCASCGELTGLLTLLRHDDEQVRERASVPSAGQVWWRAAVRARLEATQTVGRPFSWMVGTVGACALGLVVASIGLLWPPVYEALSLIDIRSWGLTIDVRAVAAMMPGLARTSGLVALGVATFLVLTPLVLYLALSDD